MPRPTPVPVPVPLPLPNGVRIKEVITNLTNHSMVIVKPGKRIKRVDTKWLGYLLLESLRKYQSNQSQFGRNPKSFDGAMKPVFEKLAKTGARKEKLRQLVGVYQKSIRGRVRRVVNNEPVLDFLGRKSANLYSSCAKDLLSNDLIASAIQLDTTPRIEDRQCRHAYATITRVYCHDDSEWSADEPYIMTGAELFDEMGTWRKETELSEYAEGVNSGEHVQFEPPSINKLFDWRLENPADGLSLSPVTAVTSITLMEHDQGGREQYYNAFKAAYSAARLLINIAEGAAGGPIGIAFAVISIIISLAMALDGEDELGTLAIRYDDVLGDSAAATQFVKDAIKGSHKGNKYRYDFSVQYRGEDYSCPVPVPFGIKGPASRTIYRGRVLATGGYAIVCDAPLRDIRWKVSPTGAFITQQGKRYTTVSFKRTGTYQVSVTAREQSGIGSHSDSMDVVVDEVQQTGPYN